LKIPIDSDEPQYIMGIFTPLDEVFPFQLLDYGDDLEYGCNSITIW